MTLRLSLRRAHPRLGRRQSCQPLAQRLGSQGFDLDVPQHRQDESFSAISNIDDRLAAHFEIDKIAANRIGHSDRAGLSGSRMSMANHALSSFRLSLGKVENGHPVCVGIVVSSRDRLDSIGLRANVLPNAPATGATLQPAIAKVQSLLDQPVVRFALNLEL